MIPILTEVCKMSGKGACLYSLRSKRRELIMFCVCFLDRVVLLNCSTVAFILLLPLICVNDFVAGFFSFKGKLEREAIVIDQHYF